MSAYREPRQRLPQHWRHADDDHHELARFKGPAPAGGSRRIASRG